MLRDEVEGGRAVAVVKGELSCPRLYGIDSLTPNCTRSHRPQIEIFFPDVSR